MAATIPDKKALPLLLSCNWYDEPRTFLGLGWQWAIGNSDCWLCCPYRPSWW